MHALLFGVAPRNGEITTDNPLLAALERTPMDYVEMPGPRLPAARLGDHRAAAHRHLRLRRQAGVHGLGRGRRRQPDAGVLVDAAGPGPRGRHRGGGARPRGRGRADRRPGRAQPVAVVRAARRVTDLPGVRGRRPEPVLELPDPAARARHPHRDVERRPRWLGQPHARAPVDVVPGARLDPRRGRGLRRPVRGVAPRGHAARAAPGRQGARVRRGRARNVRDRDPRARSTPTSRLASSRASARRPTSPASSAPTRCSRTSRPSR